MQLLPFFVLLFNQIKEGHDIEAQNWQEGIILKNFGWLNILLQLKIFLNCLLSHIWGEHKDDFPFKYP